MTFLRSIVTLVAVCLCIAFAFAVGHGLSSHNNMAYVIGAVLLAMGAAIIYAISRPRTQR
jgi:protein-S-isoprenylcysteine O-methyltransferase Ste14